eukprot:4247287-Ditylum_brightwellii.AAC.1
MIWRTPLSGQLAEARHLLPSHLRLKRHDLFQDRGNQKVESVAVHPVTGPCRGGCGRQLKALCNWGASQDSHLPSRGQKKVSGGHIKCNNYKQISD